MELNMKGYLNILQITYKKNYHSKIYCLLSTWQVEVADSFKNIAMYYSLKRMCYVHIH